MWDSCSMCCMIVQAFHHYVNFTGELMLNNIPRFVLDPDPLVYQYGRYLVLDFETTTLDKGSPHNMDNHIVLADWYIDGKHKHIFGNEFEMKELLDDIASVDFIVAHNAKFELGWLKRCGAELRDILVFDTFLAEWVIAGNRRWDKDLDSCCARRGLPGKIDGCSELFDSGVCASQMPHGMLLEYCQEDVQATHRLFLEQLPRLISDGLLGICYQRSLVTACLADIEFVGLQLDAEKVKEEYSKTLDELIEAKNKLATICGGQVPKKGKAMTEFIYGEMGFEELKKRGAPVRTATGKQKTDTATLLQLKATNKKQKEFLETYRKMNKLESLLSKNLVFFHKVCQYNGGRFYGELRQGIAQTHRLAAAGKPANFDGKQYSAQFQNLPRDYKRLFCAPDGWLIGEADGASLEFRQAAIMANDKQACQDILESKDIHTQTATYLTEHGQKTDRQSAKASSFAPLYGGSGKTKAERAYTEFFRKQYPDIARMQYGWTTEVLTTGKLRTPYGMIFYWPGTKMNSDGFITNTTNIYNYPVQGMATGEAVLCGVVWFWHRTRGLPIVLANTIHDSLVAYVHPDYTQEFTKIALQSLTHDVYYYLGRLYNFNQFPAPLGVGIKIGAHWGEGKETKVDVPFDPLIQETYQC